VRLLQESERERLPRVKGNSILIKLKKEINGIIEEILEEEEESDIKDIFCSHNYEYL
jgi:flagellar basal body-associated protein FliL